ncbi:MAG TPA: sulfotransferase [Allosphingosinicella sp.]|jgi:tetratricopeptide (TPR) repeat protein
MSDPKTQTPLAAPASPRQGSYEEALANGRRLLRDDPAAALRQAEDLVRVAKDARAFRLAGAACRALGMTEDAQGAELGGIQASLSQPELRKAAEQQAEGRSAESRQTAESFLRREPDDLLALTLSAEASISLWDFPPAEQKLRTVLQRAPNFLRAVMLLATALARQVRMRDAIAVLEPFVTRKPDNIPALNHLAQLRSEVGDVEEAIAMYERLIALDDRLERRINLAQFYRIAGRRDQAIGSFRNALATDPVNGSAWWSLANYYPDELGEPDHQAIREALPKRKGDREEGALHLALGLLADRRGEHDVAMEHFLAGKKIRLANQPYDPQPVTEAVNSVIDLITPEYLEKRGDIGRHDPSPIFVLGMPRSGTTLVERILGGHSAIEGTGELQTVPRLAEIARHQASDPENYAGMLAALPDKAFSELGERYIQASHDYRRTGKPRFIDKNNLNWLQIGLILLMLPDAKIIDIRRDAVDCCWANFKMLFAEGYPAANDLRHVGRFYSDYVRLVDAMKQAAPDRIITVRYEDVVADIAGQTRGMLNFLGLQYEPECIEFHRARGAVATASSEQVRRPLNRKGLGSATPYRPWLGPLLDKLGPLAETDGS